MRRSQSATPTPTCVRGRARLRIDGRTFYLGRFGSPEARRIEDRIIGTWLANDRRLPADFDPDRPASPAPLTTTTTLSSSPRAAAAPPRPPAAPAAPTAPAATTAPTITVGELCLRWLAWIKAERIVPGQQTSLIDGARQASHALRRHWHMRVSEFGPRALAEVRAALANEPCRPAGRRNPNTAAAPPAAPTTTRKPRKNARQPRPPRPPRYRSRSTINDAIGRVRQLFRWGVSRELVPPDRLLALQSLEPLRPGQTRAVERPPVKSVTDDVFEATLPRLPVVVADLLRVARLTGSRPGEICRMSPADIDTTGDVWVYVPPHHKNEWRGHERTIAIGPRAQLILRRYLGTRAPDKAVFSPRDAVRSQGRRASRIVRDHYDNDGICRAVTRVCEKFGIPHWTPNMLRHSRLEEVRDEFGLDAAQAVGGHKHARVSEIYAQVKQEKAFAVALRTG